MINSPQVEGGQRGLLGRLEDDSAAGGQGRSQLPRGQQQREVPGDDGADNADWLLAGVADKFVLRREGNGYVEGAAFDLGRPTGHVAEVAGGERNVDGFGDGRRFAVVERFDFGQCAGIGFDQVGQAQQQTLTLVGAHLRPARCFESLAGGFDGAVNVGLCGGRHGGEHGFVGRIEDFQGLAVAAGDPLAADQHAVVAARQEFGRRCGENGGLRCVHGLSPLWSWFG